MTASPAKNDAELVQAAAQGRPGAFRELVERFGQRLFAYAASLLGQREDAEDVLQDVFRRAHGALERFDPGRSTVTTWLYAIATNCCRTRLVRRSPAHARLPPDDLVDDRQDPVRRSVAREQMERLEAALRSLPDDQRTAFVLCEIQRLSISEAAAIEGVAEGTVKSRKSRAMSKLRAALAPLEPCE